MPGIPAIIQRNNSELNHVTKDLTTLLSVDLLMKDGTNIIDPIFLIEASLSDLAEANYITVTAFRRGYFINEIKSVTNNLIELKCHVDVISSFASEIKANKGIVYRQENNWNLYLNDGVIKAYQNPIISTQKFSGGFTEFNYVLITAGARGGGLSIGEGGAIDVPSNPNDGEGGAGNTSSKTTAGLVNYVTAQIGNPYWYGTYGNTASADLLTTLRNRWGTGYYPDPGNPDFTTQYGLRVHDCVGMIKGYRWSDHPTAVPVPVVSQDVNAAGLYNQCIRYRGDFAHTGTSQHLIGCVLFNSDLTHCGVYVGQGYVVEARGHYYGVQKNHILNDNRNIWTKWGVPDWMTIATSIG